MAKIEYYSNVDLKLNELKNFKVDSLSAAPSAADSVVGRVIYNTTTNALYVCTAVTTGAEPTATWTELAQGGDVSGINTRVGNLETAVGLNSSGVATGTGLLAAVGASTDTAAADGSLYARIKTKQDTITAGTGLSFGTGTDAAKLGHTNSVTENTTGTGSATAIPIVKYDAQGHITSVTTATVYPPTAGETADAAVWTSNGASTVGKWKSIAQTSMTAKSNNASKTEVPSSYAVQDAIDTAVTGAYKVKGTKTVAQLNGTGEGAVTSKVQGDVYNVSDSGTLTVSGQTSIYVNTGDNVVWDGTNWDKLAATITINYPVTDVTVGGTSAVSSTVAVLGAAAGKGVDTSTFTTADDSTVPSGKLVSTKLGEKVDQFASAPTKAGQIVTTSGTSKTGVAFLSSGIGSTSKPVYVKSDGTIDAIGTGTAIGSATTPVYLAADGTITAGTGIGAAGYKAVTTQGSGTTSVFSSSSTDSNVPTDKAVYTALETKVTANGAISGATKCKITYDAKGLVTGGADLAASDIPTITSAKISDFANAAKVAMSAQLVDTALSAATDYNSEHKKFTISTATRPYGVMVLDGDGNQVFVSTTISNSSIVVEFNTAITPANYTVSYILKTPTS